MKTLSHDYVSSAVNCRPFYTGFFPVAVYAEILKSKVHEPDTVSRTTEDDQLRGVVY